MTAAIGVIVGLGSLGIGFMITALTLTILSLARLEHSIEGESHGPSKQNDDHER